MTRCATSAQVLVDVGLGASDEHFRRMDSAVSNKIVKGRVSMMCGGKMLPVMANCIGGVRRWDEHKQLCILVTIE